DHFGRSFHLGGVAAPILAHRCRLKEGVHSIRTLRIFLTRSYIKFIAYKTVSQTGISTGLKPKWRIKSGSRLQ
ncbi:hypothetical protein AAKU64_004448, partial [Undibacterium sp. GrIS 1.8]|uniref:hypothetical protein n=1 Tax=Undibacterium sp. GrIS 1.8 TaxID=3143934 RepID=UPI003390D8FC